MKNKIEYHSCQNLTKKLVVNGYLNIEDGSTRITNSSWEYLRCGNLLLTSKEKEAGLCLYCLKSLSEPE